MINWFVESAIINGCRVPGGLTICSIENLLQKLAEDIPAHFKALSIDAMRSQLD